jgi:hypothetical protein
MSMTDELISTIDGMIQTSENKALRKPCPSATLSITNSTWTGLGLNPGLHVTRRATNHLSHGIALLSFVNQHQNERQKYGNFFK